MALDAVEELPDLDVIETKKKFSKNYISTRLDLNIVFDKRKSMIAKFVAEIHRRVKI